MTVSQLIEALRALPDQNAPVIVEFTSEIDGSPYLIEVSEAKTREVSRTGHGFEIPWKKDRLPRVQVVEIA